jgi:hypothetical protein
MTDQEELEMLAQEEWQNLSEEERRSLDKNSWAPGFMHAMRLAREVIEQEGR